MSTEQNLWEGFSHKFKSGEPWLTFSFANTAKAENFIQLLSNFANPNSLKLGRSPYFFRGEDSIEYELVPKLSRTMNKEMSPVDKLGYEFDSIDYFRERACHYLPASQLPKDAWDIESWLALMQHFGAATRMLDWTASVYVALYFAVHKKPDETGSVWVLYGQSLRDSRPAFSYGDKESEVAKEEDIFTNRDAFIKFGINSAKPIIGVSDPVCKTTRISAQHGVFTISLQQNSNHGQVIGKQLMDAYPVDVAQNNLGKQLWRFEVTPSLKTHLRKHLSKLGISALTLFPGLDGLGRTVTEMLAMYSEIH